jgi:hypothetical protein
MDTPPPLTPAPAAPAVFPAPPAPSPVEPALLKAQHNGGGWFFWIAGLSLVNSIAIHSGSNYNFIVGLGITAVADTILHSIDSIGHVLAYLFDAIVLGMFVLFGYFARKGKIWAFVTGFVLYALDAVLYAVLPDTPEWLAIGFHAFVLFSIWGGMQAARKLKKAAVPPVV